MCCFYPVMVCKVNVLRKSGVIRLLSLPQARIAAVPAEGLGMELGVLVLHWW